MSRIVVLVGSVRREGNTALLAKAFAEGPENGMRWSLCPWRITVFILVWDAIAVIPRKETGASNRTIWK